MGKLRSPQGSGHRIWGGLGCWEEAGHVDSYHCWQEQDGAVWEYLPGNDDNRGNDDHRELLGWFFTVWAFGTSPLGRKKA